MRQGEFRWGPGGKVLQAERNATMGDTTVPATTYVEQPHAGLIAATDERASLPASQRVPPTAPRVLSSACNAAATRRATARAMTARPGATASRGGGTPGYAGGGTPDEVEVAHCSRHRHAMLAQTSHKMQHLELRC